jgi:hypothetical protein
VTKKKQEEKFPAAWTLELDEHDFDVNLTRKYMDGKLNVYGYKSAMILSIVNKAGCEDSKHTVRTRVWLRGQDFDDLIAILKKAKAIWFKKNKAAFAQEARDKKARGK